MSNELIIVTLIAVVAMAAALVAIWKFFAERSQQRQLSIQLKTVNQRFRDLVNLAGEYITELDSEGRYTLMSDRLTDVLGYQASELVGKFPWDFVPKEDVVAYQEKLMNYISKGQSFTNIEHRKVAKDGSIVWLSVSGSPVYNESGKFSGYLAIGENITDRHDFVERLKESKISAEAADRAKSEFLAVMSHEIRTPMNGIIGFANLLANTQLDQQQREYVETIHESGDSLVFLINDILDFTKIESGKMTLESEPLNLRNCIYSVLNLTANSASEKDIELLGEIDEDVPEWILGDVARLRQVLINLISNAIKFTQHGKVVVAVHVLNIEDREGTPEYLLDFSISDTGIGIAEDRIGRLFRPFSQADSSTTRKFGGTGLGLAICKRLVTQMGGTIHVTSKQGVGSTFYFDIPVVETEENTDTSKDSSVFDIQKFVLLVGHINEELDHIQAHLRNWGVSTTLAQSRAEALAEINNAERWDCVLVIHDPTGIDAHELAQTVHQTQPELGFILIDEDINDQIANESDSNFLTGITKPVITEQLFEAVAQVLSQSSRSRNRHELPVHTEPEPEAQNGGDQLKILLAEDNKVNSRVATLMLQRMGYQAEIVENGMQAVQRAQQGGIDLILMDLQMPEMDGLEAAREIRRMEQQSNTRPIEIIAITAEAMQGDRERTLDAGMNDYLTKPIKPKQLKEALDRAIERLSVH